MINSRPPGSAYKLRVYISVSFRLNLSTEALTTFQRNQLCAHLIEEHFSEVLYFIMAFVL